MISTGSPAAVNSAVVVTVEVPGTPTVPMETISVSTVSYTHLDVYKRQAHNMLTAAFNQMLCRKFSAFVMI